MLPVAKAVIRQLQPVCFCSCISYPSKKKGKRRGRRVANVYFLFNFSIITSTCPRQEVPLWDNNSLVVSFIISFHSQLPSTSPGKFAPKVKWQRAPFAPLSSPSISVDGGARRRGKPDGLTQLCTNAVIKTSQKSHLAGDIYSVTVLMIFF